MQDEKRILVSIPTVNRPERLKVEGLLAYAHDKSGTRWNVELKLGPEEQADPADYDGIVAYISSDAERKPLLAARRPLVLIEDLLVPSRFPKSAHAVTLLCDHESEGRAAAEYFLERHYVNFAWVGPAQTEPWSESRRLGFHACVREAGFACSDFADGDRSALKDFLLSLPRPCAVLAVHDLKARDVLTATRSADLAVPGDLAVIGVDDDVPICETCAPALSSIPTGDHALGYAAGRILNELLLGRSKGGRVIRSAHHRVVSRLSTDADALADPFVARSLAWARTHLCDRLDAATLARRVGYSKRMLQLRFERALGVPLGEEIRRLRTRAAMELLAETDLPVADIAAQCGFNSVSHLSLRLREATSLTPLAYRQSRQS